MHDEPGRVLIAAARVDCFDLLPECYGPLSALLALHQPDDLRAAAASATAALAEHPGLRRHRAAIVARHRAEA